MVFRSVEIPGNIKGTLYLHRMLGRYEPMKDSIDASQTDFRGVLPWRTVWDMDPVVLSGSAKDELPMLGVPFVGPGGWETARA